MSTALQLFSFEDQDLRVVTIDGDPWWIAADVCQILELTNVSKAVERLDEDEKTTITIGDSGSNYKHPALVVNESGLYHLVFTSRKEEAKRFRRWVTEEVIPAIRKTGGYSTNQARQYQFNFKYQERLALNKNVRIYGYIPAIKFLDDINVQFLDDVITLSETSSPDISLGKFLAGRLPSEPWYDSSLVRKPIGGNDRRKWDQDIIMTVYVKDGYPVTRQVTHFPIAWYASIWEIVQTEYFPDLFPKYLAGGRNGIVRCADEELRKHITERVNYFLDRP